MACTDADLIKSIQDKGVLNPLLITHDNRIISGHRRWGSAIAINLDSVPVVIFGSTDELEIEEALIESNRQRAKTNEQIGREYTHLSRIINEREDRRSSNGKMKQDLVVDSLSIDKESIDKEVKSNQEIGREYVELSKKVSSEKPPTHKAAQQIGISVDARI